MSIQEIYESEKRDDSNLYDIHFYMEGSFWRAYEWSAYLSRIFPSELNDEDRLKEHGNFIGFYEKFVEY